MRSISGLGPTIALGKNLLNRNPNSIVASATGLLPLFKLLYARFGDRKCHVCGAYLSVLKEDEIVSKINSLIKKFIIYSKLNHPIPKLSNSLIP